MAVVVGGVAIRSAASGDGESSPIFGVTVPPGYRDWRLIAVAHEEGKLNDLRAILGNDLAINAARDAKLPYPDGTIIARLAWSYDPLAESSQAFGHPQSFVAGSPKNGVAVHGQGTTTLRLRPGAGNSASSTTPNPPARRCTTLAFPATRLSRHATSSSIITHLRAEYQHDHEYA